MRFAAVLLSMVALLGLPTMVAAGSPAPNADFTARVIELTNAERAKAGRGPLVPNPSLAQAAQRYAEDLSAGGCFGHTCGSTPELAHRIDAAGYRGWMLVGENIAGGQRTPESVVAAWMRSDGHRDNILNPAFTEIGVGFATSEAEYKIYWAQSFGARWGQTAQAAHP